MLLRLAARDLAHHLGVDDAAAELADLAAGTLDAALAVARARSARTRSRCRLAVIAMGKCGGHELNYVSDVDVIFVAEPGGRAESTEDERHALRAATQLASTLMQVCSENTAEGTIWPVDANLRPEGKSGRWSARSPATAATTSGGRRPGSSRPCSRRGRSPATWSSAGSTPR